MTLAHASHMRSHLRRPSASQNRRSASLSVEIIKKELLTTSLVMPFTSVPREATA